MSKGIVPLTNRRASGEQALVLVLVFGGVIGRSLMALPPIVLARAGYSAPLATLVSLPLIFLHLGVVLALARRFPTQSVFQYLPRIAGTWPGKFLGLVFIVYLAAVPAMGIRYYGEAVTLYLLEVTPQPVISFLMLAAAVALAYLGLESMLRFFQIITFFESLLVIPLVLFGVNNFRWSFLHPVLPLDWSGFGQGMLAAVQLFAGSELLLVFYPYFTRRELIPRQAARGLLLTFFFTLWVITGILATFGLQASGRFLYPSVEFVRAIRLPIGVLEQPSSVFSAFWVVAIIQIISLYLLAMALGLKQLLGLKNYRPLLVAIFPPLFIVSRLPETPQAVLDFTSRSVTQRLALMWAFPLLVWLIAALRSRRGVA